MAMAEFGCAQVFLITPEMRNGHRDLLEAGIKQTVCDTIRSSYFAKPVKGLEVEFRELSLRVFQFPLCESHPDGYVIIYVSQVEYLFENRWRCEYRVLPEEFDGIVVPIAEGSIFFTVTYS